MSYYKSKDPREQVNEAIQILRKAIGKEYGNKKNGNIDYINNKALIKDTNIQSLKVNLNFKDRIFHSSKHKYDLSQLAKAKEEIIERNNEIISTNPRVELAETIQVNIVSPFSWPDLSEEERRVAVFAIEQLLQEQDSLEVPNSTHRENFDYDLKKSNIGIRKLEKIGYGEEFREEIEEISEKYNTNYAQHIYSNHIVQTSIARFGEVKDNKGTLLLRNIHNGIVQEMSDANTQLIDLRSTILAELRKHDITTGLNTGLETFWEKLKIQVKEMFNKIFNKNLENKLIATGETIDPNAFLADDIVPTTDMRESLKADLTNIPTKKVVTNDIVKEPDIEIGTDDEDEKEPGE